MEKYELIPKQLLHEGTATSSDFFEPQPMGEEVIALTHDKEYIRRLRSGELTRQEIRRIGFPWSKSLVERETTIMHGTVQAALFALEDGIAFNVAGGTHHAFANVGEGFCLYNDIAVAAKWLLHTGQVRQVLVVDLDVHQGNGTAAIFQNKREVFTFSMHGGSNFPHRKETSDFDLPLADGTGNGVYLTLLYETLKTLIERVRPDFIFYQSGVDVLATDKLGKLSLSREGCLERDRIVLHAAYSHGIPLTAVMGGGYSEHIRDIVEAHCGVYRLGFRMWG